MTTISTSKTTGIKLNPALYTSPVVIDAGVTITNPNYPDVVYTAPGSTVFFSIQNNGTITGSAAGIGVYLAPGGSVTNAASASITGYTGVKISGGAGTVVNHGSIAGLDAIGSYVYSQFGVDLQSGGSVTNAAGASITGRSVGVDISGGTATVVNLGSIGSTGGTSNSFSNPNSLGVDLQSGGAVTNKAGGSITGDGGGVQIGGGADSHGGGAGTAVAGTVVNYGSIAGGFAGVDLRSGGSVTNAASASIVGFYSGVGISGGAGTVVNYGSISATARSCVGVDLSNGGTVTNEVGGSITAAFGVAFDFGRYAATLVNRGSISGRYIGVMLVSAYGAAESATNAASGTITGPLGVGISDGGTLTNAGSIVGNNGTAVNCYGAGGSNLVVLDPGFKFSGLVIGNSSASNTLELASAASTGTVTGLGTQFLHFGSIVFDDGAKWSAAGVARAFSGTVSGFAAGDTIEITGGGALPATIIGGGELQLDDGTFLDTPAQVTGIGSVAVDAGAVLDLTGGGALPATISGAGTLELSGAAPYMLVSGQILGTAQVLVDAGARLSGTGTVMLGAGATLILDPGFSIAGTVKGGGANATLELAKGSGAGTLSGLGTNFANFGKVVFDPGAVWTTTLVSLTASTGTISGFAKGDVIDLINTAATSVTYSSGKLTVLNGSTTVTVLNLAGSYTTSKFDLSSDGHSGTDITIGPLVPLGLSFAVAADKGTSGDTVTVAGTGAAGDTVTLFDGATAVGTAKVAAGGGWSITTASPLAIGAHSLSASQVDVAANQSPATAAQSLTVTSAAPNRVTFVGTAGTDVFTGGNGSDIFMFTAATLAATDTVVGGGGNDYLDMTTAGTVAAAKVSAVEVYELANGAANTLTLVDTNFTEVTGASITVYGGTAGNTVNASALTGANRVIMVGGTGKDSFTGGAGNDIFEFTVAALAASDMVAGGAGSDRLVMTTAGVVVAGGVSGVETYYLGNGAANSLSLANANFSGVIGASIWVTGGNAGNTVNASAVTAPNRVVMVGGAGKDSFTGGTGSDIFMFTVATLAATDTVAGGGGNDYLDMTTAGTVVAGGVSGVEVYELANGAANSLTLVNANFTGVTGASITVYGGAAGNTVNASGLSAPNRAVMVGGAGKDVFTGGAGNDVFEFTVAALAASDTVAGGAGADTLVMTTTGTVAAGGVSGVETYTLANGRANSLTLGNGNFTGVTGSVIRVNGGSAGNTVNASGTANRVIMVGGAGKDSFTGGTGSDIFMFTAATLAATDTVVGGGGNDYLEMTTAGTVLAGGVSGVEVYELANGAANSLSLVSANFTGVTGASITVYGGTAGNTVDASALSAPNRAVMVGGAGADTLIAGPHAAMTGGGGADLFELTTPGTAAVPDTDTIADFTHASDRIALSNAGFGLGLAGASATPKPLPAALFSPQSNGSFTTTTQRFAYNSASGALSYDADGSGAGVSRLIATLNTHPTLAASDLFFVA